MIDPVRELKVRAEILHHATRAGDASAIDRLRALAELRGKEGEALRAAVFAKIQRKHCLTVVAREVGFGSWDHARRVLEGDSTETDFGTLLYGAQGGSRLNHWFASYGEALEVLRSANQPSSPKSVVPAATSSDERAYLLAYQRHFFIANRHFIEDLGVDPDDVDWAAIGWNWAHPTNQEARRRLYGKLLAARRQGAERPSRTPNPASSS